MLCHVTLYSLYIVFFFKQKTAYEMRISDWSSDVCSSDLQTVGAKINGRVVPLRTQIQNGDQVQILRSKAQHPDPSWETFVLTGKARAAIRRFVRQKEREEHRSEEHTSALQSLMRTSSAVFCSKTTNKKSAHQTHIH